MNIPKKKMALILLLPLLLIGIVSALSTILPSWLGEKTTAITVPALTEPNITPEADWTPTIPVNTYAEKDFKIHNKNNFPVLVNSLWTVTVTDGTTTWTIGTNVYGFSGDHFIWVKGIKTSGTTEYGLYDGYMKTPTSGDGEEHWPLVIPAKGLATYTMVCYIPISFEYGDKTRYFEGGETVTVVWNPTFTLYNEAIYGFYDGIHDWTKPDADFPEWYP